jgi:hypothetical protein
MSYINIEDPKFLLATLKAEVVSRTRVLVTDGIAYDSVWREDFKKLFLMIDELEKPQGTRVVVEAQFEPLTPDFTVKPNLGSNIERAKQLKIDFPVDMKVTIGKGKTVWTVSGHQGNTVALNRTGPGRTARFADPLLIKKIK